MGGQGSLGLENVRTLLLAKVVIQIAGCPEGSRPSGVMAYLLIGH